jgi:hypothetical protein
MTRWISSDARLDVRPDSSASSAGAAIGSTICQSSPLFRTVVCSPARRIAISSMASASTVNTFSRSSS